jgi:hypothetical protein
VGYGIVTASSLPVRDFAVNDTPILKLPLESRNFGHDADDLDKCEYVVGVEWRKALPLSEAKTFPGVFANQNIVCKLRDTATIEFLKGVFPVDEKAQTPTLASRRYEVTVIEVAATAFRGSHSTGRSHSRSSSHRAAASGLKRDKAWPDQEIICCQALLRKAVPCPSTGRRAHEAPAMWSIMSSR